MIEGINLAARDLNGSSDPFVTLTFGSMTVRSKIVKKSLNPRWDQEAILPVFDYSLKWDLALTVYDHDKSSQNDLIGDAHLSFDANNLLVENEVDLKLPLMCKKEASGVLHLTHRFVPATELAREFWHAMAKYFDIDGNNTISRTELTALFQSIQSDLTEEEIDELFAHADSDGSGELSFDEFTALMMERSARGGCQFGGLEECPVCSRPVKFVSDAEAIAHLGFCFRSVGGEEAADRFVMDGFINEASASKGYRKALKKTSVHMTEDPLNVIVMDRQSGQVQKEYIPSMIRLALRLIYQSRIAKKASHSKNVRGLLRRLTSKYGLKYGSASSAAHIAKFIKQYNIDENEMADPVSSFRTFNEFFYRKLRPGARPIAGSDDPRVLTSPADCRCMVFDSIDNATELWIKGEQFSLAGLLGRDDLAARFAGGRLAIFRLAPQDYHRFHVPTDCTVGESFGTIGTEYFTVNPMAIRHSSYDVYTENKRVVTLMHSKAFGTFAYVCVGATLVGSIVFTAKKGDELVKGGEYGYFAFGGSTVICVFEKGRVDWSSDISTNSKRPLETLLQMGMAIGTATAPDA